MLWFVAFVLLRRHASEHDLSLELGQVFVGRLPRFAQREDGKQRQRVAGLVLDQDLRLRQLGRIDVESLVQLASLQRAASTSVFHSQALGLNGCPVVTFLAIA